VPPQERCFWSNIDAGPEQRSKLRAARERLHSSHTLEPSVLGLLLTLARQARFAFPQFAGAV